jgi:hypothetical protein
MDGFSMDVFFATLGRSTQSPLTEGLAEMGRELQLQLQLQLQSFHTSLPPAQSDRDDAQEGVERYRPMSV